MPASQSTSDSASRSSQPKRVRERVSAAFEKLAASAAELNAASDEIAGPVSAIEAALKKLNLGMSAWTPFRSILLESDDNYEYHETCCVGYAKISQKWGIAICHTNNVDGEAVDEKEWQFNDAPRELRLEALEKLPELLEKLAETADTTATEIRQRIALTQEVAEAIGQIAPSKPAGRK